jgi:hypothetical protein
MISEATRSTTPLSTVGTGAHATNAKSPPKPSSARSSVQVRAKLTTVGCSRFGVAGVARR